MTFKHLQDVDQSYFEHLKDSLYYCYLSLKASYYFLLHGIYPDIYTSAGSRQIYDLYIVILEKYKEMEEKKKK